MNDSIDTTSGAQAASAPEPKKALIAKLDANGVYQGTQEINESDLTAAHIHLKNGCDLPLGQHRWDAEKRTFVALNDSDVMELPDPHALRSIAVGFISLHDQGLTLPPETLQWLDFYTGSMDFMGGFNDETVAMIKRYLESRKG